MSRDNLCIGFERDFKNQFPETCKLFRKIIDNSRDLLNAEECMMLYDIFVESTNTGSEEYKFITNTFLV